MPTLETALYVGLIRYRHFTNIAGIAYFFDNLCHSTYVNPHKDGHEYHK